MISMIEGCCSKVQNHGFLSWYHLSNVAAVMYRSIGFYHDFLDRVLLQYVTETRVYIMICMIDGCCSKILNQGFLSWFLCSLIEGCCSKVLNQWFLSSFPWSRDAAVRYWSKGFYHDFLHPGMLQ
jgi:hypothetical protein